MRRGAALVLACFLALAALPAASPLAAQNAPRALSLEEALELGARTSEAVGIARAGIDRARGQQRQARSELFPQLSGVASYTRTLRSQFSAFGDSTGGPPPEECRTFTADPSLPLEERIDSLESALECSANANPFAAFADLPFGQANQYNLGLQASQLLFAGGRVRAQGRVADAGRRAAEVELDAQEAQLRLDVAAAYYDALLSDRLVAIAESTLVQTERTLENTRLARQVGNVAEFELLRAQVTRDNARPSVIQRRAQRDIAYLRLKQLLELPPEDSLALTTSLDEPAAPGDTLLPDLPAGERAAVRQAEANVEAQEGRLAVARAASLPTVRVASQFARLGYPDDVLPAWSDFMSDWNVSLSVSLPLFTGGRLSGERLAARADAEEARLRLAQTRELAALDTRTAGATLAAAEAAYAASAGTVEQAERAYAIAEIRQQEGISTQTELGDSRIQLEQARANRAQSARDLQVARMRVRLIRDLPLSIGD